MKRFVGLIFFFWTSCLLAQNNFVYVRYDLSQGDASFVVEEIEKIIEKTTGRYVVYYSNGQNPTICTKHEDWRLLRSSILTQQTAPDYYADEDIVRLNTLFSQYFSEVVDVENMKLSGKDDRKWTCTFILSDQMMHDESDADMVLRLVAINQIEERMKVSVVSYNDEGSERKTIEDLQKNKLIKYSE